MNLAELLAQAETAGASDLHLSAGQPPMLRVDGDIKPTNLPALSHQQVRALLWEAMPDQQRQDYEAGIECDFSLQVPGVARFRVNAFNHHRGAGGVFRSIPSKVPSLEELGLGQVFQTIAGLPRGLVTVTGPTGSGKSTTLAAMLDHINATRSQHLLTIEDPIEFVHESKQCLVHQRQVQRDTQSFNQALRAALREDPDIILIGEMRDLETIRLALEAAETGHLVFATLHTSSAAKTVDRIINVFPTSEQATVRTTLSETLAAVISQTLLKKPNSGRAAAHEIMLSTPAIKNLIRENKTPQIYSSIQTGAHQGMQTLDQSLKSLVQQGLITNPTAAQAAQTPTDFQ